MACCFSMLEEPEAAFYHLSNAVQFGFADLDRIHKHKGLAFIRSIDTFDNFVKNNYRIVEMLPAPEESLLDQLEKFNPEILDKIENLGDMMDQGILTKEEFEIEKQKILRGE
jgi:hypothetical protein